MKANRRNKRLLLLFVLILMMLYGVLLFCPLPSEVFLGLCVFILIISFLYIGWSVYRYWRFNIMKLIIRIVLVLLPLACIVGAGVLLQEDIGRVEVSGWYASSEVKNMIVRDVKGTTVDILEWKESPQAVAYLESIGRTAVNSERCGFEISLDKDDYEEVLHLYGYDEMGRIVLCYPLVTGNEGFEDEDEILKFDHCYIQPDYIKHVGKLSEKLYLIMQMIGYAE